MTMLDVLGHPTWFDLRGAGDDTVLLLHGGLSSSDALLDGIGAELERHHRIAAFDRRGHGRTADTPDPGSRPRRRPRHHRAGADGRAPYSEHPPNRRVTSTVL